MAGLTDGICMLMTVSTFANVVDAKAQIHRRISVSFHDLDGTQTTDTTKRRFTPISFSYLKREHIQFSTHERRHLGKAHTKL